MVVISKTELKRRLKNHSTWIVSGGRDGECLILESTIFGKVDFTKNDLRSANFCHCNLSGVNFSGANLREADFYKANLAHTNFRGADLRRANLEYANLKGADLTGALLMSADIRFKANLEGANLTGANLTGANLFLSNLSGAKLNNAIMRDTYLYKIGSVGADFTGADLTGARIAEGWDGRPVMLGNILITKCSTNSYGEFSGIIEEYVEIADKNRKLLEGLYG